MKSHYNSAGMTVVKNQFLVGYSSGRELRTCAILVVIAIAHRQAQVGYSFGRSLSELHPVGHAQVYALCFDGFNCVD